MKVNLKSDAFIHLKVDLNIIDNCVVFIISDTQKEKIPLNEIISFSIEGKGNKLKNFLLETKNKTYEGTFTNSEEAEHFINKLRNTGNYYIDININSF